MPSHFKFKEYCPLVFRNLRERFGIDDQDFLVRDVILLASMKLVCLINVTPWSLETPGTVTVSKLI